MKLSRKLFLTSAASTYATIGILRFPAGAAEFTYKLGCNTPLTHPQTLRVTEAANKIKQDSGGRLEIKVFPNSVLGGDTQMLQQVRSGALEIQQVVTSVLANVVPAAGLDSLDFVFANFNDAWAATDGPLGDYIRKSVSEAGLYPLQRTWDDGFKQIISNRPISTPEDLKGLKIRVVPAPVSLAFFKGLGASPVAINLGELYTSLQTRLVDGAELGLAAITDGKYYEVTKYLAATNHYWISVTTVANHDLWMRLPQNLRQLAEATFDTYAVRERADIAKFESSTGHAQLQAHGMTITQPDFAAFQRAVRKAGLYAQWRDQFGSKAFALLEKSTGRQLA